MVKQQAKVRLHPDLVDEPGACFVPVFFRDDRSGCA
jgi:hypothetical protein